MTRYCSSWHILRGSTLPLCPFNGDSVYNHRRVCPLIPTVRKLHTKWYLSKDPLYNYIRRSKYNILSSTFPRLIRHTSMILQLFRCLYNMKHSVIHGFLYLINSSNINNHNLRSLSIQTRGDRRRTYFNKHWMITWTPSSISHIQRANLCTTKIRKEGIEPPRNDFNPIS